MNWNWLWVNWIRPPTTISNRTHKHTQLIGAVGWMDGTSARRTEEEEEENWGSEGWVCCCVLYNQLLWLFLFITLKGPGAGTMQMHKDTGVNTCSQTRFGAFSTLFSFHTDPHEVWGIVLTHMRHRAAHKALDDFKMISSENIIQFPLFLYLCFSYSCQLDLSWLITSLIHHN